MLKFLYPDINWRTIKTIGLDMDGTLYDEYDFIAQVYQPIALKLAHGDKDNACSIYNWMLNRWKQKGSSYNHIFEEALNLYNQKMTQTKKLQLISECVQVFRNFDPNIELSNIVKSILDTMAKNFNLFLVSDGSFKLQAKKFTALKLDHWISLANAGFTGQYGTEFHKPSIKILNKIELFNQCNGKNDSIKSVVYFGDRKVDEIFAQNASFYFVPVKFMCMINLD